MNDIKKKQVLTEHLRELRRCLLNSLAAVALGFVASYYFSKEIGFWLFKPLLDVLPEQSTLMFVSYQEGFFFI